MSHSQDVLQLLWRELRINIPVTVGSAVFFTVLNRDSFANNLIYSFIIAVFIQGLIEAGRYGLSYRLRRRFPDNMVAQHNWAGWGIAQRNWPGWGLMAPWIVVSALIGYGAGRTLGDLLTGVHRPPGALFQNPRALLLPMAVVFVLAIGCTYFFYARGRMAAMEARAQAALRTSAENRLKLMESQLEPHMLFNTLANLRVLIGIDPLRAETMLDRLIAFLRATFDASRSGSHSLASEFARIGDYLELMQVRMGARLHIRIDLPAELAALPVAPLLLQPLVENAIKHGLEPKVAGGRIEVAARRDGDALVLSVRDTGAGLGASPIAGERFGTQQVRERLASIYGSAGTFALTPAGDDEGGTLATVRFPASASTVLAFPSSP
jgi:signal transduction histidine kinase